MADVPDLVCFDSGTADTALLKEAASDGAQVLCINPGLSPSCRRAGVKLIPLEEHLPPEAARASMDEFARGLAAFEKGPPTLHEGVPLEQLFCFLTYTYVVEALRSWSVARGVIDGLHPRRIRLVTAQLDRRGLLDNTFPAFMYVPNWLALMGTAEGIEVEALPPAGPATAPAIETPARPERADLSAMLKAVAWPTKGRNRVAFLNMFRDYETARALVGEMHRRGLHVVHLNEGVRFPVPLRGTLHLDPLSLLGRRTAREVAVSAESVQSKLETSMREKLSTPFALDGSECVVGQVLDREVATMAGTVGHLMLVRHGTLKAMDALKPRVCFIRADWLPLERMYIHAAKAGGAAVVVLQHGATSELSYNGLTASPSVADVQFCWGEVSRGHMLRHGIDPAALRVTGCPKYDSLASGKWEVEGDIAPRIQSLRATGGTNAVVLYTSQPYTCQSALDDTTEHVQVLEELLSTLGTKSDVTLIVKPHPAEDTSLYESRLADHEGPPFHILSGRAWEAIREVDVVITHSSGTGIEAVLLGKPVLQVMTTRRRPTIPLAELGAAFPIRTAGDYERVYDRYLSRGAFDELARECDPARFLREYLDGNDGASATKVVDATMELITREGGSGGGGHR